MAKTEQTEETKTEIYTAPYEVAAVILAGYVRGQFADVNENFATYAGDRVVDVAVWCGNNVGHKQFRVRIPDTVDFEVVEVAAE